MANLLSWLGKGVKRVENTINNDVVKPVQRDVIQPVQQLVLPRAQAAIAQVNPLDSGRTYNTVMQRGPAYAPRPQQSAFGQLTHNGATNVFGGWVGKPAYSVIKPIAVNPVQNAIETGRAITAEATGNVQALQASQNREWRNIKESLPAMIANPTLNLARTDVTDPGRVLIAQLTHNRLAQANAESQQRADLNPKAIAGNAVGALLPFAAPGAAKLASGISTPLSGAIDNPAIQKLVTGGARAVAEAPVGASFNVANLYGNNPNASSQEAKKAALTGAALAGTLSVAPEAIAAAPKALASATKTVINAPQAVVHRSLLNNNPAYGQLQNQLEQSTQAAAKINQAGGSKVALNQHLRNIDNIQQQMFSMRQQSGQAGSAEIGGPLLPIPGQNPFKGIPAPEKPKLSTSNFVNVKDASGKTIRIPKSEWDAAAGLPKELTKAPEPPRPGTDQYAEMMDNLPQSNPSVTGLPRSQLTGKALSTPNAELERGVMRQGALKADTLTRMHDILNSGGTVDEAMNEFMMRTKGTYGQAQLALQKVFGSQSLDKRNVNASLNPEYGNVRLATVGKGNHETAVLNAKAISTEVANKGAKALNAINNLSASDHALMDSLRSTPVENLVSKAENPQAFRQAAELVKNYNDYTHAAGTGLLGQNVPYRKNYGAPLLLDTSTPEAQAALDSAMKAKLKNNPGYGKHRTFADYNEAASYGVPRQNKNFAEDLSQDISRRSNDLRQIALAQGLEQAYPGQVKIGEIGSTPEGTYKQLQIAGGTKISLPAAIADKINSRAYVPTQNRGLQAYDKVNPGLKYTKLGLGGFHAFTEAGNFIGQQLASGKVLTEPSSTARLFKVMFSDKAMRNELNKSAQKGVIEKATLSGLTTRPEEVLADVNVGLKGNISKWTGIKAIHDAVFQREIPYAKLKTFEQKTDGLSINNPADVAKMRSIAKEINQNYGGINRAVEGIRPKEFQVLQRVLLATDFTEGKIHTLFDAITKGGEAGKLARQVVIGKVLLFGGIAAAGGALGGEYQGKDGAHIIKDMAGKLLDPSFEFKGYSVKTPQTQVSELISAVKPASQNKGAPWNASGLVHYGTARTAALPSELLQLANNKDYYGQPIYGKDSKKNGGGPINPVKTGENIANTVLPIAVGQASKTAEGKQNTPAAVANIIGFNARPNPINKVSFDGINATLTDTQRRQYLDNLSKTQKSITTQLTNSDVYKRLSPNDQAQALKNLNDAISTYVRRQTASNNGLGQYSPSYKGKQTSLNVKEQSIGKGTIDPKQFVPRAAGGSTTGNKKTDYPAGMNGYDVQTLERFSGKTPAEKSSILNSEKDAEYKLTLAEFERKKHDGSLSDVETIKAQRAVDRAKVGSTYDKTTRDLYGMTKSQIADYVSKNPNGNALTQQLIAYDRALYDAGINNTLKFKSGLAPVAKNASRGRATGKGSRGGKTAIPRLRSYKGVTVKMSKIRPVKTHGAFSYKQPTLRRFKPTTQHNLTKLLSAKQISAKGV